MLLSFLLLSLGHAIPQKLSQQGRLLDNNGSAIEGTQAISFRIYSSETGGTPLWEEVLIEDLVEGYFSVILGANSLNPILEELLQADPLYLEIEVGNLGPLTPRKELSAAPYARVAGVSQEVDGGSVNATEVQINGSIVIDGSGSWVGPTISLDWQNIQNIPSDFLDGDQDSLAAINCSTGEILGWNNGWICTSDASLTENDVEDFITNGALELASGSSMDGSTIVTEITDRDSFSDLGFSCQIGEIPKWDGSTWQCDIDLDSTHSFADLDNIPPGLSDGDDFLSEQDVEHFITNDALSLSKDTTLNGQDLVAVSGCTSGQVLYNDNGNWTCKDFISLLDNDSDGVLAWSDCDDNDSTALSSTNDNDCDGNASSDDCNDFDPNSLTTTEDTDCDGILNENDLDADGNNTCDDTDTPIANDADCDGILTAGDCDDNDPSIIGVGSESDCPATSCNAILQSNTSSLDGEYWLQGSGDPYQVWCDMTNDDGGWTLVVKGSMNSTYNGSKNAILSESNGFLESFTNLPFSDVMVKFGDHESTSDWVTYASVGDGNNSLDHEIQNCCSGSYDVDYNIAAPHSSSSRSSSLSGVSEVNNLSLRMSQTPGPNDAMLFVVTDAHCASDSNLRTVSADCVGAMLGFGANNYTWSSWETTGWETSCNRSGYRDSSNTGCTQQGGIFVR